MKKIFTLLLVMIATSAEIAFSSFDEATITVAPNTIYSDSLIKITVDFISNNSCSFNEIAVSISDNDIILDLDKAENISIVGLPMMNFLFFYNN